jgi:hypothetical protein
VVDCPTILLVDLLNVGIAGENFQDRTGDDHRESVHNFEFVDQLARFSCDRLELALVVVVAHHDTYIVVWSAQRQSTAAPSGSYNCICRNAELDFEKVLLEIPLPLVTFVHTLADTSTRHAQHGKEKDSLIELHC